MKRFKKLGTQVVVALLTFTITTSLAFSSDILNINKMQLLKTIQETKTISANSLTGTLGGRYPKSAKTTFNKAIENAQKILDDKNAVITDINDASNILSKAKTEYLNTRISAPWDKYSEYIPTKAPIEKRHLRATWIASVANMDWPSKDSLKISNENERIKKQKQELIKILDEAVDLKLNAVIFQVRPTSDTFYKSELSPWSYFLTGSINKNPGFDPLAFAIAESHARNIELHAWFNPYRVSMPASAYGLKNLNEVKKMLSNEPKSVYAKHPDWVQVSQDRLVMDPGIKEAREYIEASVMEVVNNYDIDGIHFDDYFYTGQTGGKDGINDIDTYNKFNNGKFSNINDWRRNNIQLLVENVSKKIKQVKPWVKFGISPAGVWRNKKDDPLGSNTTAGIPNYDHSFADTRKWVLENTIDYICPQIYWTFGLSAASFGVIAEWWSDLLKDNPQSKAHLYIGEGLYRISKISDDPYWKTAENEGFRELERQIKYNISKPEIVGTVLFRHQNINNYLLDPIINTIKTDLWEYNALVPTMKHLGGIPPIPPTILSVTSKNNVNTIIWKDKELSSSEMKKTKYFVIYRGNSNSKINIQDSRNIVAIVANTAGNMVYLDKLGNYNSSYVVTAFNRLHDESTESNIMYVK